MWRLPAVIPVEMGLRVIPGRRFKERLTRLLPEIR